MAAAKGLLWGGFVAFVAGVLLVDGHARLFAFDGSLGLVKLLVWVACVGFVAYSFYCSAHENLFRSIAKIGKLHWGRQIGLDLYLGLALTLFVIYLNEGSWLVVLAWLVPTLLYANQVTLLYVAVHFEELVARFGFS
jgi:hypothetical protein